MSQLHRDAASTNFPANAVDEDDVSKAKAANRAAIVATLATTIGFSNNNSGGGGGGGYGDKLQNLYNHLLVLARLQPSPQSSSAAAAYRRAVWSVAILTALLASLTLVLFATLPFVYVWARSGAGQPMQISGYVSASLHLHCA